MSSGTTRLVGTLSIASIVAIAAATPALAQDACPVPRDAGGNCKATRTTVGFGQIAQLGYKPGNEAVTLKARGIGDNDKTLVLVLKQETNPAFTVLSDQPPEQSCPTGFNP